MEIAVIGTGQLGSRHLQSLAALDARHSLHAVEPSAASQNIARERLGAAADRVRFHASLDALPAALDVVVVATNAAVRRKVITELLQRRRVRHLVLEKILFQSVADCLWARGHLAECGLQAWVNSPRRLQAVYRNLRASLPVGDPLEIRITGSRWGLATSGVHFLDLVLFLSRATDLAIGDFEMQTFPSSRHRDCLEATGRLAGSASPGVSFSITAWAAGDAPVQITVEGTGQRWVVAERDSEAVAQHATAATGWQWVAATSALRYQSQLTGPIVEELGATGSCGLATLDDALLSHLPFLRSWNRHFAPAADPELTRCPVT